MYNPFNIPKEFQLKYGEIIANKKKYKDLNPYEIEYLINEIYKRKKIDKIDKIDKIEKINKMNNHKKNDNKMNDDKINDNKINNDNINNDLNNNINDDLNKLKHFKFIKKKYNEGLLKQNLKETIKKYNISDDEISKIKFQNKQDDQKLITKKYNK